MKNYKDFLNEDKSITPDDLSSICRTIITEIVSQVGIPLGVVQQAITVMDKPFPHIHCQREIVEDNLDGNNKFLADEVCKMFASIAADNDLEVLEVKDGDKHGKPGDVLAKN